MLMAIKTVSNMQLLAVLLLAAISAKLVYSQTAENLTQNACTNKISCHECIQASVCAWCAQPNFGNKPRCFQPNLSDFSGGCPEEYIYNPDNEQRLSIAKQLKRGDIEWGDGAVQIYPQRVHLKLRMNQPHRLNVQYFQAEDYPVDLYYLIGLSTSMENDKRKLSSLGAQLSATMLYMTSNFRLGLGSFVDKVQKRSERPCENCGYKNHMKLGVNATEFSSNLKRVTSSGNVEASKGGLDAIMQAITCRQNIGWRDEAQRLLVFATDAGFHKAGDGKLFEATTPNDGECHMNSNGDYTHSSILDYPSISQINSNVLENRVNIIFAVAPNKSNVYEELSRQIEGSSTGILSEDASNVVELVKEQYNKISSSIVMKDTASSAIKVTYYSSCLRGGTPFKTSKCDGLKIGDMVTFEVEIIVTECPPNPKDWLQTFQIFPVGINETLTVDLQMLCSCPCEIRSPNCEGQRH